MNIFQGLLSWVSLYLGKAMQTFPLQRLHVHKSWYCIIYRGTPDSCQLSVSNFNSMEINLGSEIHCGDVWVGFTTKPSFIFLQNSISFDQISIWHYKYSLYVLINLKWILLRSWLELLLPYSFSVAFSVKCHPNFVSWIRVFFLHPNRKQEKSSNIW